MPWRQWVGAEGRTPPSVLNRIILELDCYKNGEFACERSQTSEKFWSSEADGKAAHRHVALPRHKCLSNRV